MEKNILRFLLYVLVFYRIYFVEKITFLDFKPIWIRIGIEKINC